MVNPTLLTLLLQWINFAVLLFLLTRLLYRPLLSLLDKRRTEVQGLYDGAESARREADEVLETYRNKLAGAEQEGVAVKFELRNEGLKEREKIIERAEEEAAVIVRRGHEELALQEKRVRDDLRREAVGISLAAAGRLLEREVDSPDNRRFVETCISELGKTDG